jgi:outer membrane lipoprotein-sorting protein
VPSAPSQITIETQINDRYSQLKAYCDKFVRTLAVLEKKYTDSGERCVSADSKFRLYMRNDRNISPPTTVWSDGTAYHSYDSERGHSTRLMSEKNTLPQLLYGSTHSLLKILPFANSTGGTPFVHVPALERDGLMFFDRRPAEAWHSFKHQVIGVSKQDGLIRYVDTLSPGVSADAPDLRYIHEFSDVRVDSDVHASNFNSRVSSAERIFNSSDQRVSLTGIAATIFLLFTFGKLWLLTRQVTAKPRRDSRRTMRVLSTAVVATPILVGAVVYALYLMSPYSMFVVVPILYPVVAIWAALAGTLAAMLVAPRWQKARHEGRSE